MSTVVPSSPLAPVRGPTPSGSHSKLPSALSPPQIYLAPPRLPISTPRIPSSSASIMTSGSGSTAGPTSSSTLPQIRSFTRRFSLNKTKIGTKSRFLPFGNKTPVAEGRKSMDPSPSRGFSEDIVLSIEGPSSPSRHSVDVASASSQIKDPLTASPETRLSLFSSRTGSKGRSSPLATPRSPLSAVLIPPPDEKTDQPTTAPTSSPSLAPSKGQLGELARELGKATEHQSTTSLLQRGGTPTPEPINGRALTPSSFKEKAQLPRGASPASMQKWSLKEIQGAVERMRTMVGEKERERANGRATPVGDVSIDFDKGNIDLEVVEAMMERGEEWLATMVEVSAENSRESAIHLGQEERVSFDLQSLDPDLRALLTPNNVQGSRPSIDSVLGITNTTPTASSPQLRTPSTADAEKSFRLEDLSPLNHAPPLELGPQSSPARRPRSFSQAVQGNSPAAPPLFRSVTGVPPKAELALLPSPDLHSPGDSDKTTRALERPRSAAGVVTSERTRLHPRPVLPPLDPTRGRYPSVDSRDGNSPSPSPSPRPYSSLSMNRNHSRRPTADSLFRNGSSKFVSRRKRSSSVEDKDRPDLYDPFRGPYPPPRPSVDLGPRTARAFAAAGVLDSDKDRITAWRTTTSERDFKRVASDAYSSWGRSGFSRTTSDLASQRGESSPTSSGQSRTAFSASTSSAQHIAAIQALKDRHELETEALLGALAESKKENKELRAKNEQLEDHMQELAAYVDDLEDRLATALARLRLQERSNARMQLKVKQNALPIEEPERLMLPQPLPARDRTPDLPLPSRDHTPDITTPENRRQGHRRQHSATSSIFPNMPGNMSMLVAETPGMVSGLAPSLPSTSPPPSPTLVLPRMQTPRNKSVAANSETSPTTADFSFTSTPGSPGSLKLRPEDERHLGDLFNLGFSLDDSDS